MSSPARWVSWEPICVRAPAGVVVRGCIRLQWIFLRTLSTRLPIPWWVIYEHICPHLLWMFSSFWAKSARPTCAPPSLFTPSLPKLLFFCLFLWMKKVLKGKHFADVKEVKQKMAKALKGIKIDKSKNCFKQWKKYRDRCIASNIEYFEGRLKFKHLRINTKCFINKFLLGPPHILL